MKKSESFSKDDRIMVPSKDDLSLVNGVPEEHQSGRRVRIFVPTKPATQSGNYGTRLWRIEFDNRERWENPLMGWASTGDPLSNTVVEFETSEAAEEFCRRQGWPCYVEQPNLLKMSVKSYGSNFSWNKRTRIGSK
ncbi:NADH dehydrogenase [ubiquinone] iron-sulfur protein 4 [Schistosoma japonicum]|nr:NADH dehydrogenase [ubiquinone] iron-sulfur protein 4 [Schistosoma japonicum]